MTCENSTNPRGLSEEGLRLFSLMQLLQHRSPHGHPWDPADTSIPACADPECTICAVLLCPWGDPLHLHQDDCPACVAAEAREAPTVS